MVSIRVVLAVTVLVVAVAQCAQVQVVRTVEIERTGPYQERSGTIEGDVVDIKKSLQDMARQIRDAINQMNNKYLQEAKNSLSDFSAHLKQQLDAFAKKILDNDDLSVLLKNAIKKYKDAMDNLAQNLSENLNLNNLNERFMYAKKYLEGKTAELMRKAEGSSEEVKRQIADFSDMQLDKLVEHIRLLQAKIAEYS